MSKYTKAREIIEKEIQDNIKTVDGYCEYCKDMPDDVWQKHNLLFQTEGLMYTNQVLKSMLKRTDFSADENMNNSMRYVMLIETFEEVRKQAAIDANSIYGCGQNIENLYYQRTMFIVSYVAMQLNKIYMKLCNISEEK